MIKIRRSLFETNSSSADRYDEYEDDKNVYSVFIPQNISIDFTFDPSLFLTDTDKINIIDKLLEDDYLEFITSVYDEGPFDSKSYDVHDDNVELYLTYSISAAVSLTDKQYKVKSTDFSISTAHIDEDADLGSNIKNLNETLNDPDDWFVEYIKKMYHTNSVNKIKIDHISIGPIEYDEYDYLQ